MRYLPTSKLTPGMALGQNIYDGSGRVLLEKHLLLTEEAISNLEFMGFPGIYIDDDFTRGIEIQQVLNPQVRSQALKVIHDLFSFDYEANIPPVAEIKLKKTIESVVEDILNNGDIMLNVLDIKNYNDYIFFHSVNVAMLSVIVGARYGLEKKQLFQLTTAAMLHDIGKKFVDVDTITGGIEQVKAEQEQLRQHPKLGAEFLKCNYNFPPIVVQSVLTHHEAYNGKGYPEKRAGEEIPIYARIIRMTDCYDILTSKHPSKPALSPSDTVKYLMSQAGGEFDPNLVEVFIKKIAVYPVGCEVVLSDGRHAVVVQNFERFPLRPLVKMLNNGALVNLRDDAECRNITIVKVVLK